MILLGFLTKYNSIIINCLLKKKLINYDNR